MRPLWALVVAVHGVGVCAQLLAIAPPLQWLNLDTLTSGSKPPPLKDAILGFDPLTNVVVLFGGESPGNTFPPTTYVLNLQTLQWSIPPTPQPPIPAAQPPGRSQAIGGPDMAANYRDDLIMFGGRGENGPLNDIWMFNYAQQFWYELPPPPNGPPARWGAIGGADPTMPAGLQTTFYVTGGMDETQSFPLSDIWELTINGALQANTQDLTAQWSKVTTSTQTGLVGQAGTVMAHGRLVAFGGCQSASGPPYNSTCATQNASSVVTSPEISSKWSTAPGCPAARFSASITPNLNLATSDFQTQVFMMFGDIDRSLWANDSDAEAGEVAILDVAQGTWGLVLPSGDPSQTPQYPKNRQGAAILSHAFGASAADTIIYGGMDASGTILSDMWILRAYPAVIDDPTVPWTGFGNGKLQSGPNASGAGVTVQFKTDCATPIKPGSSTSHTTTSTSAGQSGTSTPGNIEHTGLIFSTSIGHKVLSPISVALALLAVVCFRLSFKPSWPDSTYTKHRMGYVYFTWTCGAVAYALGVAGFVVSLMSTSSSEANTNSMRRGLHATNFLSTTHGKAGFAIFICLYGAVPAAFAFCRWLSPPARHNRMQTEEEKALAARSDKSDMSGTPGRGTSFMSAGEPGGEATPDGMRERATSTPVRKLLAPGTWNRQRRVSESDMQVEHPADPPKAFEVIRPQRRSDSHNPFGGTALDHNGHTRQQPSFSKMLSDINWLERRRSIGAVNELDYAMSRLTPDPSLPMTPMEPHLAHDACHARNSNSPAAPSGSEAASHVLAHTSIFAACALSLVALHQNAPVEVFVIFLLWCTACYVSIVVLAWQGRPRRSMLSVALYRLRGEPEDHMASGAEPLSPTRPDPTPLQGCPTMPSSSSSRGPYAYHQPPYRLAPSHADDDDLPRRGISPSGATSADIDIDEDEGEEDENERQIRLEQEMERRDVTIISVPRKRLFITNE